MKWPWVSRAAHERALREVDAAWTKLVDDRRKADNEFVATAQRHASEAIAFVRERDARYDALLDKYHALAMPKASPPAPVEAIPEIPEPDVPPDVVLAAMQQISPVPDKTYEANWAHWDRNKARAKMHPEAFAQEILEGAVFEPPITPPSVSFMIVPSRTVIE